jgi:hypothetical protein
MKTTWNIIIAETNRLKAPITTAIYNNQNSHEPFNKYFLSITENIPQDAKYSNKQGHNINRTPTNKFTTLTVHQQTRSQH